MTLIKRGLNARCDPKACLFSLLSLGRRNPTGTFKVALTHSSVCSHTTLFWRRLAPYPTLPQTSQSKCSWGQSLYISGSISAYGQKLRSCRAVGSALVERGWMCSQETWFLLPDHRPMSCGIWGKSFCLSGVTFLLCQRSRRWAWWWGGGVLTAVMFKDALRLSLSFQSNQGRAVSLEPLDFHFSRAQSHAEHTFLKNN